MIVHDLTVRTPCGSRVLLQGLFLKLNPVDDDGFKRILVVGRSGTGKSSLVRTLAGLWLSGDGEITRPQDSQCMFLPQNPFMCLGNLRDQLTYPDVSSFVDEDDKDVKLGKTMSARDRSDLELRKYLKDVGMGDLPDRFEKGFETVDDWNRLLSPGEQQR